MEPWSDRRGLAPGVRELDGDLLVLAVRKVADLLERRNVCVRPDAGVLRGDASVGSDSRSLNKGQTGPAGKYATDWNDTR
jgi:hypothetical protein